MIRRCMESGNEIVGFRYGEGDLPANGKYMVEKNFGGIGFAKSNASEFATYEYYITAYGKRTVDDRF